ncbi:unnamed protein product [Vitrella brassicaformis CCMP3155]|uniref:Dynein-1, subspecies f n=5 Tax=Vitrella brassicaformis TaxID=1169539 RepID=A0A0G4EI57_VITBC|nr:unnamed protein product [Vitrella brassicaformis CCMP3155]|eukprot:CEL96675.1 unnamed protein product [Vitrella brassicaformis CCMP3155]
MGDDGDKKKEADLRVDWVLRRVQAAFGFKKANWDKFKKGFEADEANSRALNSFLNDPEAAYISFMPASGEAVTATCRELPPLASIKKKILVMSRSEKEVNLTKDNMNSSVICTEVARNVMDILNNICHSAYLTALSNPLNQRGWSDLVSKDLLDKFHVFLANLYVTTGLIKGKTLLPLPPTEKEAQAVAEKAAEAADKLHKDRVHILEGAVVMWTKQIRYVLKQDPETPLKQGLNPEPIVEIRFWRAKAANLNSIHQQLETEGLKKVLKFLEQSKSTYTNPFAKLHKEVEDAREEANDNVKFLNTLEPWIQNLMEDTAEFTELPKLFEPIMHLLLLTWKHSKFYNTAARLVVLVRELCNTIIAQACRFINGPQVFSMIQNEEANDAVDKLDKTLQVCNAFRECYFTYKDKAEHDGHGWRIQTNALFVRLDAFRERVRDILDFTRTVVQFSKLDKIEIGGTKGKALTTSVANISEELKKGVEVFQQMDYDMMDVSMKQFEHHYYQFRCTTKELERRLGSVLTTGFEDADTIQGRLKLFESFEGLLERPIIQDELEKKHSLLLQQFKSELREVQAIFNEQKATVDRFTDDAPIFSNLPPVAGAVYWIQSLLQRLEEPMQKLLVFSKSVQVSEMPEDFDEVEKLYKNLRKMLEDYQAEKIASWEAEVVESSKDKLKQRLLRRLEQTGLLRVNFDPALTRLLREVRYFLLLGLPVPEAAAEIFGKAGVYRKQTGSLDLVIKKYNGILTELLPVEEPLLEDRIVKMDTTLSPGLTDLKWKSTNIDDFLGQATGVVNDVSAVVDTLKNNLKKVSGILANWCEKPLLERKPKPMSPEDFEQVHKAAVGVRHHQVMEEGKELLKLVRDSADALQVKKGAPQWKAYVDFVNNIVIEGFVSAISVSMQYLCDILDPAVIAKSEMQPLFDVKIELTDNKIVFEPPFDHTERGNGMRDIVSSWVRDFFAIGTLMARLDSGSGDYLNEMKEHFNLQLLLSNLSRLLDDTELKCAEYRQRFLQYSFLWTEDIDEAFELFLCEDPKDLVETWVDESGSGVTFTQVMDMIGIDLGPKVPPLSAFDEKITSFVQMRQSISNEKTPVDLHWLRINAQPVKVQLSQLAGRWAGKYVAFLQGFCIERIDALTGFINKASAGLSARDPNDAQEDKELLYSVMTHIRDVKIAIEAVKALFGPLRDQTVLLKKHGSPVPDDRLAQLESAPSKWEELIRRAFEVKEAILPLQTMEMWNIRKTLEAFGTEVEEFRSEFEKQAPFNPELAFDDAYSSIDEFYNKTIGMEKRAKDFNNLETLFDMARSGYRQLKETCNDLGLLKELWDAIAIVKYTFDDWKSTLWDKIDTDDLLTRVKDLSSQIKYLPKELKGWRIYQWLVEDVKNMSIVLPLINDLHSEFMRERHWKQLMTVTGKTFSKGPDFCLDDLLKLKLHEHADDVSEIVDQAQKEAKIEKKLGEIKSAWTKLELGFEQTREDVRLLEPLDDIIEVLDQHSMDLMGMVSQGKFVEFCRPVVDEWQANLRTVDNVLTVWMKVQKNWKRLEPIFMQSEDIRSQLPEDSKRFEQLDNEWKEMMNEASQSPNVVQACCAEGREDLLKKLHENIELCEKSLNDYLEQKKKAFPRFYFVSNQALLEILSNGNNPIKVAEFLGDCFDGISTLDFELDKDPKGKISKGLYSKEKEYVPFLEPFVAEGAVETYLSNLEAHMRRTLRDHLEIAKNAAENWEVDKPREVWLEDYCAQIALVASQLLWTEETQRAFEELEGGSENAMKDYKRVCDDRIEKLIRRVQTNLAKGLRVKIITLITIDVHARDVIEKFVQTRLTEGSSFAWQSQLRFYWQQKGGEEKRTCVIKICDWTTTYMYEYVGNCGRLVITPLTDRCYITLTQALNLVMGGAPAGPAGTGKTETTKDLSRAIGLAVFVFNCSDQMNYLTMAQIFMGLAQSGAWGCFDEFNRISIEVLSVVSTQVKSILDAIKEGKERFQFMDDDIGLVPTTGFFITMNPGYAGRTELPENLKALFRSCAMVVPDVTFICENMLMSEGFLTARSLAHKFVTLYGLSKELLSKAMHYDWGLRAVKAVLRQAGGLKRADPDVAEDPILMRALRDFNVPKITTEDKPIFLRLIEDLFPGVSIGSKRDVEFEKIVSKITKDQKLQPEDAFVLKCVQLKEILEVRHCCFVLGPPGSSKSCVWKTLAKSLKASGEDSATEPLNPKAIKSDELYGYMTKTKEWKDGAIAVIMRNMSKELPPYKASIVHKWIILDGDIDAEWIESMNTVMDDNKVLTLVSNERIPFTASMRMLFEIENMKHASPATVSRGGVLFINETDVGWKPYVESWRDTLPDQVAQSQFYLLFSSYFEQYVEYLRRNFNFVCPMWDMAFVQSICCLIDAQLYNNTKGNMEALKTASGDDQKVHYEAYFIFALMWTIGGCVADDKIVNFRNNFNGWMRSVAKVKFPEGGSCFDYKYETAQGCWVHWNDYVKPYEPIADLMFSNIVVSNVDLVRFQHVLELHVVRKKGVLFVGSVGTAKTTIVKDYLAGLAEETASGTINLNSYTDSLTLQRIIESFLEKRTGRTYGPAGNKRMIFFIDDFNMPKVDKYDTQAPLALLRQLVDYQSCFDRDHLEERKEIIDLQYVACMNPKAGSFNINPQLQRQFTVLTCFQATAETIQGIFNSILGKHLAPFDKPVQNLQEKLVAGTIDLFNSILNTPAFLPTTKKFHYQFNLKHISSIFQGVVNSNPAMYKAGAQGSLKFCRLWLHEVNRVFKDRLVSESDMEALDDICDRVNKKHMAEEKADELFEAPNIFTSFVSAHGGHDRVYLPIKEMPQLKTVLEDKLKEYNETFAEMNLVLFDDAMEHVCRICRIIDQPAGNALLVGVGGSGKQSLSRLASFISGYDVITILVNQQYDMNALKLDLQEMYKKAAVRPGSPHSFLLTDGQITDERFLIYLNDFLSSGNIPDLFTREEYDGLLGSIRNAAKAAGVPDQRDALFSFFIDRVRRNLHVILCHSPVGDTFRVRARKFPALISSTAMDQFHPWPRNALIDVASIFLRDVPLPQEELRDTIAQNMSEVHLSINQANQQFLEQERRYNYTTPKSFLELIEFYKKLLSEKRAQVEQSIERLEKGLYTLQDTKTKVEGLQEDLKGKMIKVEEKKGAADQLIAQVTKATAVAEEEQKMAAEEEAKTNALAAEAAKIQAAADEELKEAMPAMERAKEAVDCLTKSAIQELKALGKPPVECIDVTKAVLLMRGEKKNLDWKAAQKMMNNPGQFLDQVKAFDAENMTDETVALVQPVIDQPFFNYETMFKKSFAAANLANWVVNIVTYNRIYKKVKPLMDSLSEASENKRQAEEALAVVQARVKEVQERVAQLNAKMQEATDEKEKVEAEANACLEMLQLAERLVNGLADENTRWSASVEQLKEANVTLIGDSLLAAAFVSYIGAFSSGFRVDLWQNTWLPDIEQKQIPFTKGVDPLTVLTTDANIAKWKNEGLPADRLSIENAAVLTSCSRWPLIIDPQLQGVKWLKQRFGDNLTTIQLTHDRWFQKVVLCIQMGGTLLIEAVQQEIDAILDPLLSRAVVKRGRSGLIIKLGGEEVDYDAKFQLLLQTKLANPHYRPEIAAQCTLINFCVTPEGLEEQILAMVVNVEKPELEQSKQELVRKQNEFKVTLAQLEDDLLAQLSAADPATILTNIALIEGLENTKKTATEIQEQVKEAQITEIKINESRETYRPVAAEASMLYFLIIQMWVIAPMYQYSLDSFVTFMYKGIEKAEETEDLNERCKLLIGSIRMTIFTWVVRGLFERHKLIFNALLTFRLLQRGQLADDYDAEQFQFLLRGPMKPDVENPLSDWLPNSAWYAVQKLIELPGFDSFAVNMEKDAPNRFKEWFNEMTPEEVKLPLDWKKLDNQPFQKLLVLRCLRPDRMTIAVADYIRNILPNGADFMDCDASSSFADVLMSSFKDSTDTTPIFFILSPGADPVKEVESMGRKNYGITPGVNFHNVAMGQGQDVVAMAKLHLGHKEGHWVMLQNIHLMPKWLIELEKKLDSFAVEGSHPNFRCYLSSDPCNYIPIGILERSIKLTNEPPQGLKANLKRAFAFFSKEDFDDRDSKVKSILFGLCFFHAIMLERKKFGPKGWNMNYPFSIGDLRDSATVLFNYLEQQQPAKVPWDDLRYIFGEIMYGGHIVDARDRLLCNSYLEFFMQDELLDESEMFPFCEGKGVSFRSPLPAGYEKYVEHLESIPGETPLAYGLHPNAEIGFRTQQCQDLFGMLMQLQPRGGTGGEEGGGGQSVQGRAEQICNEIVDDLKDVKFQVEDIGRSIPDEEKGPYQYVFLQECQYMNLLVEEMLRSLQELQLGLKGELTMSDAMEDLIDALFMDKVPKSWEKLAFPSTRPLASWLANLKERIEQLNEWTNEPTSIPKVVFLSKLFNPQSFLTAIKQVTSQQQSLELNKLLILTDVTKRDPKSIEAAARDGAYVAGLFLEGARWDVSNNQLEESKPKEMFFPMPVINCKAQLESGKEEKNVYTCPVYKTTMRGATYVFNAQLRTRAPPGKWILAGCAMILDIGTEV